MHGTFKKSIPPEKYPAYEGFIKDGQIEPHEIPSLLERDPEFAKWLRARNIP